MRVVRWTVVALTFASGVLITAAAHALAVDRDFVTGSARLVLASFGCWTAVRTQRAATRDGTW